MWATARKLSPPPDTLRPADSARLDPDWPTLLPQRLDELAEAWDDPAAWAGETTAGDVTLPAAAAGMFALDELVVHGWELARATGVTYEPDPDAVEACARFLADAPRAPELFGPVVAVSHGAPALDRLIGLTGRDPGW